MDFGGQTVDGLFSTINDLGRDAGSIHGIFLHPPLPNGAETGDFRPFSLVLCCQCHILCVKGSTVLQFERGNA